MELIGFSLDTEGLTAYGQELDTQLTARAEEIYELAGGQFNINSPMQLGNVLFEKLGLPHGKKTQRGYSTNADVLESLRDKHPIIDCILDYRKLAKLKNTYVDGLIKVVGEDGRVHSIFKQTETRTGRISSAEPNLQNIPVRTDVGSVFRKFFYAAGDRTLVDADYSQIELRVLAHIAQDENMIEGFRSGADIHTQTAAQVFGMPPGVCHQPDAQPGQGSQLRHCIRHRRLFPLQGHRRHGGGGQCLYQRLSAYLSRRASVYGGHQAVRQGSWLCQDAVRTPPGSPRDERHQPHHQGLWRTGWQ